MDTLLVTGHRGLLGSACVRQLSHRYKVLTLETSLHDDRYVRFWFAENKPDYVIHCAAKVGGVKANQEQPVQFLVDNLSMQNVVIQAAADFGVKKLVFVGTSCLYPKFAPVPVKESSLLTGPFEPSVAAYATAKLAGYALCKAYNEQYGKTFVTVCPANLYGLGDNYGPSAHVIPALLRKFKEAGPNGVVKVWGDGTAIREFLSAEDAARAIGIVLEHKTPDLVNIGSGEGTSIAKLAYLITEATKLNPKIEWDTSQPTGIPVKTFDISILKGLGFRPSVPLFEGLRDTWNDFINNPNPRSK